MDVFLPVRVVERYGIHHIPVTLQGVKLLSRGSVPELACPIIASCDKANTSSGNTAQGETSSVLIKTYVFACKTITSFNLLFTMKIVCVEQRVK